MNLHRKLEIATVAIRSISTHGDEDAAVIRAALDRIAALLADEHKAIEDRIAERIDEAFTAPKAAAPSKVKAA